jgi:hypothetical protein
MCRTLVREGFFLRSGKRALRAASQSKTEWTERALKGERALMGESKLDTAGLGGSFKLGKVAGPVGGADIGGAEVVNGLGGIIGAVAGGGAAFSTISFAGLDECSPSQEHSSDCSDGDFSLVAVAGADVIESGVV